MKAETSTLLLYKLEIFRWLLLVTPSNYILTYQAPEWKRKLHLTPEEVSMFVTWLCTVSSVILVNQPPYSV